MQPPDAPSTTRAPARGLRAAALLVLLAGGPLACSGAESTPAVDDGLAIPAPDARVASGATFAWRAVPGAESYRFEMVDAAGAVVHQATTTDTSLVLPPGVRASDAAAHRWSVEARMADGTGKRTTERAVVVAP